LTRPRTFSAGRMPLGMVVEFAGDVELGTGMCRMG